MSGTKQRDSLVAGVNRPSAQNPRSIWALSGNGDFATSIRLSDRIRHFSSTPVARGGERNRPEPQTPPAKCWPLRCLSSRAILCRIATKVLVCRSRQSLRTFSAAKIGITGVVLIALIALAAGFAMSYHLLGKDGGWAFLKGVFLPSRARPLTSVHFEYTRARLRRGEYLVAVARCFSCHSETDQKTDLPLPNVAGAGTVRQQMIRLTYPNITPDSETGRRPLDR